MVCDLLERGLGIHHTTLLINAELKQDGLEEVGASCVRDTYYRLCPEIIPIRKVAMGTNDAHSSWAKASFNISKQLAICFGILDPLVILDPPMPDPLPLRDGSVAAASAATLTLPALPVAADGGTLVINQVSTEVVNPAAAEGGTSTLVINQVSTEVINPVHGSVEEASASQCADGESTEVINPAPPPAHDSVVEASAAPLADGVSTTEVVNPAPPPAHDSVVEASAAQCADGVSTTEVVNPAPPPAHDSVVEASAAQLADGVYAEVVNPAPPPAHDSVVEASASQCANGESPEVINPALPPAHDSVVEASAGNAPPPLARYFDPAQLPKLSIYQIGWWDESHRKCGKCQC